MYSTVTLNDVAVYSEKRISMNDVTLDGFVTTDNMLQNKLGITKAVNLPPQDGNMPMYEKGDILIANIRPYLKKIWFAKRDGGCSSDVLVFNIKDGYDPKFIYYTLLRDDFFDHMMRGSKGTKMPRGDKAQIMDFIIPKMEIDEQEKIASALSSLDKKIELNNQINQELESMAKTLYDYWFIQFDFPDANGKPYKASGGKMVYNDELKREIPEGWKVDEINNLIEVKDGTHDSPKKSDSGYCLITSKHLKSSGIDFNEAYLISDKDFDLVNKRSKVEAGDFLVSMIGTVGLTHWVKDMDVEFAIKNIGLFKTSQKPEIADYLYASLNSSFGRAYIQSKISTGTSQPYITLGAIREIPIILPSTIILNAFIEKITYVHSKIYSNMKENQRLTELRDWLLPMLMNGQVKVS